MEGWEIKFWSIRGGFRSSIAGQGLFKTEKPASVFEAGSFMKDSAALGGGS